MSKQAKLDAKESELKQTIDTVNVETEKRIKQIKTVGAEKKVAAAKINAKINEAKREAEKLIEETKKEALVEIDALKAQIDEARIDEADRKEKALVNKLANAVNEATKEDIQPIELGKPISILNQVKKLENGEYIGLINKSIQSRDLQVVSDLKNLFAKIESKGEKAEEEGCCSKIYDSNNKYVRTYSLKEHGEDYAEIAKKYISNNRLSGYTIEDQN